MHCYNTAGTALLLQHSWHHTLEKHFEWNSGMTAWVLHSWTDTFVNTVLVWHFEYDKFSLKLMQPKFLMTWCSDSVVDTLYAAVFDFCSQSWHEAQMWRYTRVKQTSSRISGHSCKTFLRGIFADTRVENTFCGTLWTGQNWAHFRVF